MKRDDVTRIFPDATKEQIDSLMSIAGGDITKLKDEKTELQNRVDEMQKQITDLKGSADDVEALKKQIADFEEKEQQRKAEAEAKEARAALEARFGKVAGDKKFIHDFVKEGVLQEFAKAIQDKDNIGKADSEIFTTLTQDKGYFAAENGPAPNMPGAGNSGNGDDDSALDDASYYAKIFAKNK